MNKFILVSAISAFLIYCIKISAQNCDVNSKNWKFNPGEFDFKIGASSGDIRLNQAIDIK